MMKTNKKLYLSPELDEVELLSEDVLTISYTEMFDNEADDPNAWTNIDS